MNTLKCFQNHLSLSTPSKHTFDITIQDGFWVYFQTPKSHGAFHFILLCLPVEMHSFIYWNRLVPCNFYLLDSPILVLFTFLLTIAAVVCMCVFLLLSIGQLLSRTPYLNVQYIALSWINRIKSNSNSNSTHSMYDAQYNTMELENANLNA